MPRPTRFFVRVWTPDPTEEGPDDERDTDVPDNKNPVVSMARAKQDAARHRLDGKNAGAHERRNIRYPEHAPPGLSLPAHLYEWDTVQIDEDDIDRELEAEKGGQE